MNEMHLLVLSPIAQKENGRVRWTKGEKNEEEAIVLKLMPANHRRENQLVQGPVFLFICPSAKVESRIDSPVKPGKDKSVFGFWC
jgi:hypothetical protein